MPDIRRFFLATLCCTLLLTANTALAIEVSRAQFTTIVQNREPGDAVTTLSLDDDRILFFSEIRNGQGHTITHRWLYGDRVMAEVTFDIGGPRWRIWSSKTLLPAWAGTWTVQVVNEGDVLLAEQSFTYGAMQGKR